MMLSRYLPEIRKLVAENKDLAGTAKLSAMVMEEMNRSFGGKAQQDADNLAGTFKKLKIELGELKSTFSALIFDLEGDAEVWKNITENVNDLRKALEKMVALRDRLKYGSREESLQDYLVRTGRIRTPATPYSGAPAGGGAPIGDASRMGFGTGPVAGAVPPGLTWSPDLGRWVPSWATSPGSGYPWARSRMPNGPGAIDINANGLSGPRGRRFVGVSDFDRMRSFDSPETQEQFKANLEAAKEYDRKISESIQKDTQRLIDMQSDLSNAIYGGIMAGTRAVDFLYNYAKSLLVHRLADEMASAFGNFFGRGNAIAGGVPTNSLRGGDILSLIPGFGGVTLNYGAQGAQQTNKSWKPSR